MTDDDSIDWSGCPLVQSKPGYVSGAWCLKSAPRMPVDAIIVNWDAGHSIDELATMWPGLDRDVVEAVVQYARSTREKGASSAKPTDPLPERTTDNA